jgi:hypothetical protein
MVVFFICPADPSYANGHRSGYAILNVVIFWNSIEILRRWNFFKEIWTYPVQHSLGMLLIFFAFLAMTIITFLTPCLKSKYVKHDI